MLVKNLSFFLIVVDWRGRKLAPVETEMARVYYTRSIEANACGIRIPEVNMLLGLHHALLYIRKECTEVYLAGIAGIFFAKQQAVSLAWTDVYLAGSAGQTSKFLTSLSFAHGFCSCSY